MLQTEVVEKIKIHFMFNNIFERKCVVCGIMWGNVEWDRPRMTNMAHAHRMLDIEGYKHTQNKQSLLLSTVTAVA
jgi:hypothetical protein